MGLRGTLTRHRDGMSQERQHDTPVMQRAIACVTTLRTVVRLVPSSGLLSVRSYDFSPTSSACQSLHVLLQAMHVVCCRSLCTCV